MRLICRGRHSIGRRWWLISLAPRIVNDVAYATRIHHENHFSWQPQYLVRLDNDACVAPSNVSAI